MAAIPGLWLDTRACEKVCEGHLESIQRDFNVFDPDHLAKMYSVYPHLAGFQRLFFYVRISHTHHVQGKKTASALNNGEGWEGGG